MSVPSWEDLLLAPDLDRHADERAALLARARAEAERVSAPSRRGPGAEQVPLLTRAPLRACSRCATSRHSHEAACPCGGRWL